MCYVASENNKMVINVNFSTSKIVLFGYEKKGHIKLSYLWFRKIWLLLYPNQLNLFSNWILKMTLNCCCDDDQINLKACMSGQR